jgi:hypothetical protein
MINIDLTTHSDVPLPLYGGALATDIHNYRIVETEKGFYVERKTFISYSDYERVKFLLFFTKLKEVNREATRWHPLRDYSKSMENIINTKYDHPILYFKSLDEAKEFVELLVYNLKKYPIYHSL